MNRGFTLLEVLMAVAILGLGLSVLLGAQTGLFASATRTEHISIATLPGMRDRTFTINALSKTFAATGWRIGWAICPPAYTRYLRAVHDVTVIQAPTPPPEATRPSAATVFLSVFPQPDSAPRQGGSPRGRDHLATFVGHGSSLATALNGALNAPEIADPTPSRARPIPAGMPLKNSMIEPQLVNTGAGKFGGVGR